MTAFRGKADYHVRATLCPLWEVDSKGRRNTLVFEERWSVEDGISPEDLFHREAKGGDLGSLAAWGVDEFDRAEV